MPSDDKPRDGGHYDPAFGERRGPQGAPADIPFRLVIVGDFGGRGDGRLIDVSGEDLAGLLAAFGAAVDIEVPNLLGSQPPTLAVRLAVASLRDLDPKTIPGRVPQIVAAEAFARNVLEGRADMTDTPFDYLSKALTPGAIAAPEVRRAAVSAFASSFAGQAAAPMPDAAMHLLSAQALGICSHPAWLGVEAAWRSLRLLLSARDACAATRVALCDVRLSARAGLLLSEAFGKAMSAGDEPSLSAILLLGAFGSTDKDMAELARVADAAGRLGVATIVTLSPDFFGAPPSAVAAMDDPAALLSGAHLVAWQGLRVRSESRWVFAVWNDFLLGAPAGGVPILWGEAGTLLAAQCLRSLAKTGWPTEILGAETALGGFDMAEAELPSGSTVAVPLRAVVGPDISSELGRAGIIGLVCQPDRDQVFLNSAPCVHAQASLPDVDCDRFGSLPSLFASTFFEKLLRHRTAEEAGTNLGNEHSSGRTLRSADSATE